MQGDSTVWDGIFAREGIVFSQPHEKMAQLADVLIQRNAHTLLDLGCGTGLASVAFRPHVERLVGVDLSPLMIAEADKRKVYDRLEDADVNAFLRAEVDAQFDLVIAADVFVYMVDFADTCARIARVLTSGGLLAFTVETHSGDGIIVGGTLRYAHAPAYVMDALALAGFAVLSADPDSIRSEQGEPVPGLVVVARHN